MNGGYLNQRNDDLLDKLDSSPREDIEKLIKLQKETNINNIGNIIRDSLNAIEENVFKLDSLYDDFNESSEKKNNKDNKDKEQTALFDKISKNLNNKGDNFIIYIEKLYKLLFIPYSKELIIKKELGYKIDNNTGEYVNNRILGRILYNIHYFRNYSKNYPRGEFSSIISKIKESLLNNNYLVSDDYKKIEGCVNQIYITDIISDTDTEVIYRNTAKYIFKSDNKYDKLIKKINNSIDDIDNKTAYKPRDIIINAMVTLFTRILEDITGELPGNNIIKTEVYTLIILALLNFSIRAGIT